MNETKVYFPFYQVKVAGQVVDHTNNRESAHATMRNAWAKPAELWLIPEVGSPQLLAKVAA